MVEGGGRREEVEGGWCVIQWCSKGQLLLSLSPPLPPQAVVDSVLQGAEQPRPAMEKLLHASEQHGYILQEEHCAGCIALLRTHIQHLKSVARKLNFYVLWLIFFCNGIALIFVAVAYKFFGMGFIDDDHFLAIVGSTASVFNCLGRIIW